jgi:nucleotide-binding universal stress UspA family protein
MRPVRENRLKHWLNRFRWTQPMQAHTEMPGLAHQRLQQQSQQQHEHVLQELGQIHGVSSAVVLRDGDIVVGTHGRRGLTKFLLGSVAERVVSTASCPVVTVRGK